ncbi:hypothetical protein LCGC14_1433360 [marine sediment metagenome]|uniref:Uncharacterized protein n=1 Tax=marine sediment metagenome TaxID=412755 RepID=A0A0F9JNB5_9ZZZZ
MKKLFLLFIMALVFSGCGRTMEIKDSALEPPEKLLPLALKVGDKMPDMSGTEVTEVLPWFNLLLGKSGERHFTGLFGEAWTMEAFLYCDGELSEKPFGHYASVLDIVYLDPDMDGEIDEVVLDASKPPQATVGITAPDCPPPATDI